MSEKITMDAEVAARILYIFLIRPAVTMWLWNYYTYLSHLPTIGFWEAFGLLVLIHSLINPAIQYVKEVK